MEPVLATLPVSMVVIGTLVATVPASLLMKRVGRRPGFLLGAAIGLAGALTAAFAIYIGAFWLFSFGCFVMGLNGGFGQYIRFQPPPMSRLPISRAAPFPWCWPAASRRRWPGRNWSS